jgi:predicted type IV restriction endonuclease
MREGIQKIREAIQRGSFPDEAAISNGVVLQILHLLKWPAFDTDVVWPQYGAGPGRVDFALCHPPRKPEILVEVKRLGSAEVGERQLFEYAFHHGIPMVVLTDGQEWHFYLPAERGSYQERRVYLLDLLERDLAEVESRLERYLGYDRVRSGEALVAARSDYGDIAQRREVAKTLPEAWRLLVEEDDGLLAELVAEKVESLCGFKPPPDATSRFLASLTSGPRPERPKPAKPAPSTAAAEGPEKGSKQPPRPASPTKAPQFGFTLKGQHYPARSAKGVLIKVLEVLSSNDPSFLERMAARPKHGRKRRFIARSPEELYPDRPDLARDYVHELSNGWWIGTNYGSRQIRTNILAMAAEVAGLRYGDELDVRI